VSRQALAEISHLALLLGQDEWMNGWVDGCQAIIHSSIHPTIPLNIG